MKLFKIFAGTFLALVFFVFTTQNVEASLVFIDKDGEVIIKVLSSEDSVELEIPQRDYLEVKDVVDEMPESNAKISLKKDGEEIKLNVSTSSGDKSLDVTNFRENVIEIEERAEAEKIFIGIEDGKFSIKQRGIVAQTDFEINIDPATAGLTLTTPSGLKFLSVLPRQAADSIFRSKLINKIPFGEKLEILELDGRDLAYVISGEKVVNVFNMFEYSIPVTIKVSASTGEILTIDEPSWLKIFGFLFV